MHGAQSSARIMGGTPTLVRAARVILKQRQRSVLLQGLLKLVDLLASPDHAVVGDDIGHQTMLFHCQEDPPSITSSYY